MTGSVLAGVRIPSAAGLLGSWIEDGGCLGGQLFVWQDGEIVADLALGSSRPGRVASTADVARYYCAIKPLTACCLARAADEGKCELDDPVSRYLPGYDAPDRAGVTLRGLLNHSSGLPDGPFDPYRVSFRDIAAKLATVPLPPYLWSREPRYNDVVSWCVLAAVVERVYGEDFTAVARRLFDGVAAGQRPDIRMTDPDPDLIVPCHQWSAGAFRTIRGVPDEALLTTANPAHGGFGSARDLGLFYAELVRCATGSGTMLTRDRAREICRAQSVVEFGLGVGRMSCGLGFVVDPNRDAIGAGWGPATFGHAGFVSRYRVVHGFADPDRRLAVAVRLFSVGARNNWRFHKLGSALHADLTGSAPAPGLAGFAARRRGDTR